MPNASYSFRSLLYLPRMVLLTGTRLSVFEYLSRFWQIGYKYIGALSFL